MFGFYVSKLNYFADNALSALVSIYDRGMAVPDTQYPTLLSLIRLRPCWQC